MQGNPGITRELVEAVLVRTLDGAGVKVSRWLSLCILPCKDNLRKMTVQRFRRTHYWQKRGHQVLPRKRTSATVSPFSLAIVLSLCFGTCPSQITVDDSLGCHVDHG